MGEKFGLKKKKVKLFQDSNDFFFRGEGVGGYYKINPFFFKKKNNTFLQSSFPLLIGCSLTLVIFLPEKVKILTENKCNRAVILNLENWPFCFLSHHDKGNQVLFFSEDF